MSSSTIDVEIKIITQNSINMNNLQYVHLLLREFSHQINNNLVLVSGDDKYNNDEHLTNDI